MATHSTTEFQTIYLRDLDTLMKANAKRIFSEKDPDCRIKALQDLWAPASSLFEEDAEYSGHEAISAAVGSLLERLPDGTAFVPEGNAAGHHGIARLRWRAASAEGTPLPVSGTDIAFVEDGLIVRLYVILDAVP